MPSDSSPQSEMLHRSVLRTVACSLLGILLPMAGCNRAMYEATSLPPNLRAGMVTDIQSLDLSSLAYGNTTSQRINVGDTLNLTVVTGAEERKPETWPLRVADDGSVEVPLVGKIQLAGLDVQTAQDVVRQASIDRQIYKKPSVAITVESRQTNRVTVLGAVHDPGEYDLPVGSSHLLAALASAGSVTEDADRFVEIRQPARPATVPSAPIQGTGMELGQKVGPETVRIDLLAATQSQQSQGYPLRDGSVVMVRKRAPRYIHVLGLVRRPDQFSLPPNQNVRVLDAIALAGGRTLSMADKVIVVRQIPGNPDPAVIDISIKEAKEDSKANILLADGDVISIEETPTTFVLGTLQQFIRLGVNGSVAVF